MILLISFKQQFFTYQQYLQYFHPPPHHPKYWQYSAIYLWYCHPYHHHSIGSICNTFIPIIITVLAVFAIFLSLSHHKYWQYSAIYLWYCHPYHHHSIGSICNTFIPIIITVLAVFAIFLSLSHHKYWQYSAIYLWYCPSKACIADPSIPATFHCHKF